MVRTRYLTQSLACFSSSDCYRRPCFVLVLLPGVPASSAFSRPSSLKFIAQRPLGFRVQLQAQRMPALLCENDGWHLECYYVLRAKDRRDLECFNFKDSFYTGLLEEHSTELCMSFQQKVQKYQEGCLVIINLY